MDVTAGISEKFVAGLAERASAVNANVAVLADVFAPISMGRDVKRIVDNGANAMAAVRDILTAA
jgi:hypothetical protein